MNPARAKSVKSGQSRMPTESSGAAARSSSSRRWDGMSSPPLGVQLQSISDDDARFLSRIEIEGISDPITTPPKRILGSENYREDNLGGSKNISSQVASETRDREDFALDRDGPVLHQEIASSSIVGGGD